MTTTTLAALRTSIYDRIWQDTTSKQYPVSYIDRLIKECVRKLNNLKANPTSKVSSYSFNKSKDGSVASYSASSINVSSIDTYCPWSGKIIIDSSHILSYSAKNTTSFTSLTGLSIVYKAGDRVSIGYAIPSGVKKISEVIINWVILTPIDRREFSIKNNQYFYCIVDDYIFLPWSQNTTDTVTITYILDNILPISDSSIIDFEEDYMFTLEDCVLARAYIDREDTRKEDINAIYKESLKLYKSYISQQTESINNSFASNVLTNF